MREQTRKRQTAAAVANPGVQRKPSQIAPPARSSSHFAYDFTRVATYATRGTGEPLPFLPQIQRSFGTHDLSGVRAHLDPVAAGGARAIGAEAFTTHEQVAFARPPSLFTAAHEAAHVIQQRSGRRLTDREEHERHADIVASRVVAGGSSESLFKRYSRNTFAWPSLVLQRQGATLTNALFTGDSQLQAVLDGKNVISAGAGTHIRKIQVALMNLGYALPIYGSDSVFGDEMGIALGQFQNDEGLTATQKLDAVTMAALDKKTPATPLTKFPEYAELLGDGLLDFTVGVGYDEDGNFDQEIEDTPGKQKAKAPIVSGLNMRGFTEEKAIEAEKIYAKAGLKMPQTAGGRYFIKKKVLTYQRKDVDVIIRLVTYKDSEPKKSFLEAMQRSDVSIYTGHGRYGSGPDFDIKTKGAGNILINPKPTVKDTGTPGMYEKLKKQGVQEELPAIDFEKKYKIWFFDGCNTKHYLPAIRKRANVGTKKTDVFGWGSEINTSTTGNDVLSFIDNLIAMQSAQKLIEDLNKINKIPASFPTHGVGAEGIGDNPVTK